MKKILLSSIIFLTINANALTSTYIVTNKYTQQDEFKIFNKELNKIKLSNKQKIRIRKARINNSIKNQRNKKSRITGYSISNEEVNKLRYINREVEKAKAISTMKANLMEDIFEILNNKQKKELSTLIKNKLNKINTNRKKIKRKQTQIKWGR